MLSFFSAHGSSNSRLLVHFLVIQTAWKQKGTFEVEAGRLRKPMAFTWATSTVAVT